MFLHGFDLNKKWGFSQQIFWYLYFVELNYRKCRTFNYICFSSFPKILSLLIPNTPLKRDQHDNLSRIHKIAKPTCCPCLSIYLYVCQLSNWSLGSPKLNTTPDMWTTDCVFPNNPPPASANAIYINGNKQQALKSTESLGKWKSLKLSQSVTPQTTVAERAHLLIERPQSEREGERGRNWEIGCLRTTFTCYTRISNFIVPRVEER